MQRHEIDNELSTTGAQELLDSASAAHLAYTGKDGTPRVIPLCNINTGLACKTSLPNVPRYAPKIITASRCDTMRRPSPTFRIRIIRKMAGVRILY